MEKVIYNAITSVKLAVDNVVTAIENIVVTTTTETRDEFAEYATNTKNGQTNVSSDFSTGGPYYFQYDNTSGEDLYVHDWVWSFLSTASYSANDIFDDANFGQFNIAMYVWDSDYNIIKQITEGGTSNYDFLRNGYVITENNVTKAASSDLWFTMHYDTHTPFVLKPGYKIGAILNGQMVDTTNTVRLHFTLSSAT